MAAARVLIRTYYPKTGTVRIPLSPKGFNLIAEDKRSAALGYRSRKWEPCKGSTFSFIQALGYGISGVFAGCHRGSPSVAGSFWWPMGFFVEVLFRVHPPWCNVVPGRAKRACKK